MCYLVFNSNTGANPVYDGRVRFFNGRALSWSRIERILSGRPGPTPVPVNHLGTPPESGAAPAAGEATQNGSGRSRSPRVAFAELHATSAYNFLSGASEPEELVRRAVELGLSALCVMDRDGFYGLMKFAEAAAEAQLPTVYGAELTLEEGALPVLPVIARGPEGYRRLSRLIVRARMDAGEKDKVSYPPLTEVARQLGDTCLCLVDHAWIEHIDALLETFGPANLVREYACTMTPEDADHHAALDAYNNLRGIVTALPGAATRDDVHLAGAKRALARRQSLADAEPDQHPMGAGWLRSGEQMERLVPGRADLIAETVRVAEECALPGMRLRPTCRTLRCQTGTRR